jgi:hypothetical protein
MKEPKPFVLWQWPRAKKAVTRQATLPAGARLAQQCEAASRASEHWEKVAEGLYMRERIIHE